MKWLIVAAASLAVVSCASLSVEDLEFQAWKLKFGKSYRSPEEEAQRKDIWLSTRRRVLAHNILADQGIKTYRMGMNQFSDMNNKEYHQMLHRSLMANDNRNSTGQRGGETYRKKEAGATLPAHKDWRETNCVTPVRNQGSKCNSCWAFTVAGALESHTCINYKRLPSLSVQQLIDCCWDYDNQGCAGGLEENAFKYLRESQGIVEEEFYPYKSQDLRCPFEKNIPFNNIAARCLGYVSLRKGDELELQEVVATVGPVTVAVDAEHDSFQHYKSGVYYEPQCIPYNLIHSMLVVGYGTEGGQDYWLVKNSYDTTWGEGGYIKMARNKDNNCGIASDNYYPLV